ncbi:MAG: hypothetical protein AAF846_29665 [Chloroflexota bacterium]
MIKNTMETLSGRITDALFSLVLLVIAVMAMMAITSQMTIQVSASELDSTVQAEYAVSVCSADCQ